MEKSPKTETHGAPIAATADVVCRGDRLWYRGEWYRVVSTERTDRTRGVKLALRANGRTHTIARSAGALVHVAFGRDPS